MPRNKVIYGDEVLIDLTGDTVTADTLAEGVTAHDAAGNTITGTMQADNGGGASNLVNGSAVGSLRSVGATAEDDNYTIGEYAVALGNNTEAEGEASHAEGKDTTASGLCSHAEGNNNTASGVYSHTEGDGTVASGSTSHAEGSYTRAIGVYSHSEGVNSIAKGPQSHAEGYGTIAAGQNQHAQGKHNIEDTENKYVHIVGNGDSSSNRSNAHTLDWDGVGWFAGGLRVGGTSQDDGEEVALKSDLEGLGGGGGSDVLNDDGIIKKEHLPDGYPYLEVAEILPETSVDIDPDEGTGFIVTPFSLVVGGEYTITWGGIEYNCIGQEYISDGIATVVVGNIGVLTGGDLTEEPFLIMNVDAGTAAATGFYGMLFALDGSVTATVAISGTLVQKISKAYLPKMDGVSNLMDGNLGSLRSISSAEESDEYVLGVAAVAVGIGTTASGEGSHAECYDTSASGNYSHAEGMRTTASGYAAHAEGSNTTASGEDSHAEGSDTTASGNSSHAEGCHTFASGDYSHCEGWWTTAAGEYQHVQGKYNIEDTDGKYAHIVGNGTSDVVRSNAHTIDWEGNAWFAGTVEGTALILSSPNGTRFEITVDDSGNLTAAEVTD